MIMKTDHRIDDDGTHHLLIDGLRVWLHQSDGQWVAQGIDINYATYGESRELAEQAFMDGLCRTICENLQRFHSVERLIAKRAPDAVFKKWIRAVETQELEPRSVELARTLPSDLPCAPPPIALKFFEPRAHSH